MTNPPRTVHPLPLNISEQALQSAVIDYARLRGWLVVHFRHARTGRGWATPLEGDPGSPDLVLARRGAALLVELKSQHGRSTIQQRAWLAALGDYGRLWRPSDWPTIVEELT